MPGLPSSAVKESVMWGGWLQLCFNYSFIVKED